MPQEERPPALSADLTHTVALPAWPVVLRALREAAGVNQEAWSRALEVGRTTVQRWERGETVPDPTGQAHLLALCRERGLFRRYNRGALAGATLTAELVAELLADARRGMRGGWAPPLRSVPAPAAQPADHRRTNLPAPLSSFVGRAAEQATVQRLLESTRLLTLTGTGGVGKTRLALAVSHAVADQYPDGVWWVELAALTDPALVPQAAATALGVREVAGQPLTDTLAQLLGRRHLLLVLDNCEHLVDACAALAETLLLAAPQLQVLATSREGLRVPGETRYRVPSLTLPKQAAVASADDLLQSEAVRLFVERAQAAVPAFALTAQTAPALTEICRRLDGIPLALELAAARVMVLSVSQLAARLEDGFGMLTGGSRTAPSRQQTLRATLDWSHELLSERERALLRRLSIFAGGWSLAGAEAVGAGEGIAVGDVLELLDQLVDKSLVLAESGAEGETRYRLLETVRHYGLEQLREADEAGEAAHAHAHYALALAEEAEPKLRGPQQGDWMDRLARDHDNLRGALGWADAAGEATLGLRLAGALSWFWYIRGHFGEGLRWLERFLERGTSAPPAVRAKALQGAAALATMLSDVSTVRALYEEALALWQEIGDWPEYARALHNLGNWIYQWEGDYDAGRALFEEALAIGRRYAGTERHIGFCLSHLGFIAYLQGDYVAARGLLEESLAVQRPGPDKYGIGMVLSQLARVARAEGDTAGARALQAEALTLRREFVGPWGAAFPLAGIAELALDGHPAVTARLLGVLDAMDALRGELLPVHYRAARAAMTEAARRALGDAEFEAARAAGRSLPLEQAVAEALAFAVAPSAAAAPTMSQGEATMVYPDGLTPREVEVLRLVAAGKSNREIADALVISLNTVLRHVTHILQKTGTTNRTDAATYAHRHGLTG